MQKVKEHLLVMEVEFNVDLVEFGEYCKKMGENSYLEVLKQSDFLILSLLFYDSTQRELSHVGFTTSMHSR